MCAEMDASEIEGTPTCPSLALWFCFDTGVAYPPHGRAIAAAGTCQPDPVRWFGWGIFTEDGDLDYYAYATDEETALTIARDAGCEGDLSAVLDVDNVGAGTCQEQR